jgi:ketosteroid isomerase-like protein
MAVEKRGWEAWKARDAKALEDIAGLDLVFVDLFGRMVVGKPEVIKEWTDPQCTINSVAVTDGKAVSLTKDAALLTYKGTAEGKCGDLPLAPLWGTTVAVKDGDAWKAVYIFESPA